MMKEVFLIRKKIFLFMIVGAGLSFAQFNNVKINSYSESPNEVSIAVNPSNPNYIAASSNLNFFYVSSDGGNTWNQKTMSSSFGIWGDPCVIYDAEGQLYFGHLSDGRGRGGYWVDRIVVQRSTNNGTEWDYDYGIGYNPPVRLQDKEWLAADLTNSPNKNNLYVAWTEFDKYGSTNPADSSRILFSRSTDKGQSWSDPFRISTHGGDCLDDDNTVEGCVPAVGPNGEVYLSWAGPLGIMFDKSTDGGITFYNDTHVTNIESGWAFDIPGIYRCNGMPVTACDISNSSKRGNIYLNWSDQKNGDTDVYFCKSVDGGLTWTAPTIVNNDFSNRHQFFTWMTVDPITGIIYIIFYDRRHTSDPNDLSTHVYIARSDNGGETFKNIRISETPFIPNKNIFFGDYTNIAAYNGKIYPIWMRMDGNIMSVWTAPLLDSQLVTDVKDNSPALITDFKLFQNYPNPFNPSTTISYNLPRKSYVRLKVYDILGNEIAMLVNKEQEIGNYNVQFSAEKGIKNSLPAGIYLYRLESESVTLSKKMVLIK